jgi:DNA/RNA endonuclease YhcR with UshA esterase domain
MNKSMVTGVFWVSFLFLAIHSSWAEDSKTNAVIEIKAGAVKENVGKEAVVSGTVAEVNKAQGLIRLNFEKPFPNQSFTAVIFAKNTNSFGNLDELKGKKVEVSGKITEYRGRPQIILTHPNQLKTSASEPEKKSEKKN